MKKLLGLMGVMMFILSFVSVTCAHAFDLYTVANVQGDVEPPVDFFNPGFRLINFDFDTNGNPIAFPSGSPTIIPFDSTLYSAWGVNFSTNSTFYIVTSANNGTDTDYAKNSPPNSLFSWDYVQGNGPNYARFTGSNLPTAAGIVFTDSYKLTPKNPFYFQAYDKNGLFIPGSRITINYADDTYHTSFDEDAFVGIEYSDGISKVEWGTERPLDGGLEVDNLMFGQSQRYAIPEPSSIFLLGIGLVGFLRVGRRKYSKSELLY